MRISDFRSDTITKPTEQMRKAMYKAEVGDDVYSEDPTINKLENISAQITGMEDAMFVPSGTMGNQLALLTHTERGQEIILEEWSHIYKFEVGGLAFLSGLQVKTIKGNNGVMNYKDLKKALVLDNNIHCAQTGLICLENTHNMAGGIVTSLDKMEKIYNEAKNNKLPVHLDGARIFNAATYLGVDVKKITEYTDSVMFCLSKGLCAPVGSILAGKKEFIKKAKRYRKLLGGGMRQAGILAAAGIVALNSMVGRLREDHDKISKLAEGLGNIHGINIDKANVQTNILMINIEDTKYSSEKVVKLMKEKGVLASAITENIIRFVTHKYISYEDVNNAVITMQNILKD